MVSKQMTMFQLIVASKTTTTKNAYMTSPVRKKITQKVVILPIIEYELNDFLFACVSSTKYYDD